MYLFALLFESSMLITTFDKTSEIPPCIALNKMFKMEVPRPYKIHSKRKYPETIISSAMIVPTAMLTKRFVNLTNPLYMKQHTIAIDDFITSVAGAYIAYPSIRSARAEPTPAQIALIGPSTRLAIKINASPRFIYPMAGIGIAIKYVATKISAVNIAHNAILCMLLCFIKIISNFMIFNYSTTRKLFQEFLIIILLDCADNI